MSNKKRNSLRHLWDEGLSPSEAAHRTGLDAAMVARLFNQFDNERQH